LVLEYWSKGRAEIKPKAPRSFLDFKTKKRKPVPFGLNAKMS
jgi:hypothetical protein